MSKNIKILATVVPNPYKSKLADKEWHFSVFFSPRLPETGYLYDYYEINNWDKLLRMFVEQSKFYLQLSTEDKVIKDEIPLHTGILCNQRTFENGHKIFGNAKKQLEGTDEYEIGGKIWKSIFKENTPVEGWYYEVPQEVKNIASFKTIITKEVIEEIRSVAPKRDDKPLNNLMAAFTLDNAAYMQFDKVAPLVETTSPQTQKKVTEKRSQIKDYKDYVDIKKFKTQKSVNEIKKENQEFHKKFAALSHYPDLLRATGWILDFSFKFDLNSLPNADLCRLQIRYDETDTIEEKEFKLGGEIEFICPWTTFNKEVEKLFSLRYKNRNGTYFKVTDGFINTIKNYESPSIFAQIEDKKRQIMDIISSLMPPSSEIDYIKDDKLNLQINKLIDNNSENFKSKISTGIGLLIDNNPSGITGTNTKANQDAIKENPQIIWGEDLDVGYRIDVSYTENESWYSLCNRKADYYIDVDQERNKKKILLLKGYSDEPWVAESAQLGATGTGYIHEEIVRWNNWSLTCPHTGIDPEFMENPFINLDNEYNDLEVLNIEPDGKLLPLRFNKSYKFRLRIVDICGNSASVADKTPVTLAYFGSGGEVYSLRTEFYKRLEEIYPPDLFFAEEKFENVDFYEENISKPGTLEKETRRVLKEKYHGEELSTMVIKSYDDDEKSIKECIRIFAPPQVTPHFSELQGAFDDLLKQNDEVKRKDNIRIIYNLCKGKPQEYYDWTFWDRVHHFSTWNTNDQDEPIGNLNSKIDYLTDKDVNSIHIFGIPISSTKTFEVKDNIFDRFFNRIILRETADSNNKNIIPLKKGKISECKLQCSTGDQGVVCKERVLTLVHAVQRPIDGEKKLEKFINENGTLGKIFIKERENLWFKFNLDYFTNTPDIYFPNDQVGEFRIVISYRELEMDKTSKIGYKWKTEKGIGIFNIFQNDEQEVFTQIVKSFSNYKRIDGGELRKSKSSLQSLEVDSNLFTSLIKNNSFDGFKHNFPDTKYRDVKYELKAYSKFRDFFIDIKNEDDFAITYTAKNVIVPNSSKPKAPKINKIIPVFTWIDSDDTITRLHNKFRVYFDDEEWYITGAKEGIAVIVMENDSLDPKDNSVEEQFNNIFSQIGMDPIQKDDSIPSLKTSYFNADSLIKNEIQYYKREIKVDSQNDYNIQSRDTILNDAISVKNLMKLPMDSSKIAEPADSVRPASLPNFNFIVYPVFFDCKKNNDDTEAKEKFYVNIEFDSTKTDSYYFPFMHFALSRYQENSIRDEKEHTFDYRFSNVVMTPQMQVIPMRQIKKEDLKKEIALNKNYFKNGLNCLELKTQFFVSNSINENNKYFLIRDRDNKDDYYFEEYEVYEVDGKFKMNEDPQKGYSPRNDVSKRLVFSYKILV